MSTHISVPPQLLLERILTLEIVRVTERAAVSAARLRGHGQEKPADQAAGDAMRRESFDASEDGTTFPFHLRHNVKWQSNNNFKPTRDLNADDVIFTFE